MVQVFRPVEKRRVAQYLGPVLGWIFWCFCWSFIYIPPPMWEWFPKKMLSCNYSEQHLKTAGQFFFGGIREKNNFFKKQPDSTFFISGICTTLRSSARPPTRWPFQEMGSQGGPGIVMTSRLCVCPGLFFWLVPGRSFSLTCTPSLGGKYKKIYWSFKCQKNISIIVSILYI